MTQSQILTLLSSDSYFLVPSNPVDPSNLKQSLRDILHIRVPAGFKYGLLFYALYNIDAITVQYSYLMDYELQDLITSGCVVTSKVVCVFDREQYLNRKADLISTIRSDVNWPKIQLKQRLPTYSRPRPKIVQEEPTQPQGLQRTKDMKITPKLPPNQINKVARKPQSKVPKQDKKPESTPSVPQEKPKVQNIKILLGEESSEEYEYRKQDYTVQHEIPTEGLMENSKLRGNLSNKLTQPESQSQSEGYDKALQLSSNQHKSQLPIQSLKPVDKPILKIKPNVQKAAVKPTNLKNQSTMLNYFPRKS